MFEKNRRSNKKCVANIGCIWMAKLSAQRTPPSPPKKRSQCNNPWQQHIKGFVSGQIIQTLDTPRTCGEQGRCPSLRVSIYPMGLP